MSRGEKPLRVLWRSALGAAAAASGSAEGIEIRAETDLDRAAALRDWAHVLVDGKPPGELLDGAALRAVVVPYAGVSAELREAVAGRPHLRLYNSHFNAAFVAQHAVALLLAAANRLGEADRALRRGDWRPRHDESFLSLQLDGRRVLLLGYGAIGKEVAKRLSGFEVRLSLLRRNPDPAAGGPRQYGPHDLHEALRSADAVVASLPSTPATRGLLDAEALAALPDGALLVNVGRGDLIDQWALYRELASGRLHGAALDVWWRYPESEPERSSTLPAAAPLQELPNLTMSPHRANQVARWEEAAYADVLLTLSEIAAGRERNRVDPGRGY